MKKESKRNLVASSKSAFTLETLPYVPLHKFCTKKLLEIALVAPLTTNDQKFLDQIIETGKQFEYLSDVHFITYTDVLDLVERLSQKKHTDLPKLLKQCAEDFVLKQFQEISDLAVMTKLKIIECLYTKYSSEVKKMQRSQELHDELNALLKDCETKEKKKGKTKGKKGKKDKSTKSNKTKKSKSSQQETKPGKTKEKKGKKDKSTKSKKTKKSPNIQQETKPEREKIVEDYTKIVLKDNEVTFDYNVDNHVTYFVLSGFSDPLLFEELSKIDVGVSAIIDVSLENSNGTPSDFMVKLDNLFQTPKTSQFLENTIRMKYRGDDKEPTKKNLEELLRVVKKINYFKRQHLAFIRSLKLYDFGSFRHVVLNGTEKYSRIMNYYPPDVVNIALIVAALVQQICNELTPISSTSDLLQSPLGEKTYQVHEEDVLKMSLETYKELGRVCYDTTLDYLKLIQPLAPIESMSKGTRLQNRAISTEDDCYCDNTKDLFDYFHLAMFNQMTRTKFVPKTSVSTVLERYDEAKQYQNSLPRGEFASEPDENEVIKHYHMKEELSTSVLRQLVFKAMNRYSCWRREFCEESESILVKFHDNLDDFGIETKIWNQALTTPICLRDFCRFVAEEREEIDQEDEEIEECEGLSNLNVPELYQEYHYLLGASSEQTMEETKRIFNETIQELVDYPNSHALRSYCSEDGFVAYDLGPKRCQLTGHTTIFRSDDGVKVTIDTSRFMVEDPKCTITLTADDNSLIFHAERPSKFNFVLRDGTIVNFLEFGQNFEDHQVKEESDEKLSHDESISGEETQSSYNDLWLQILRKSKIQETFPKFWDKRVQLDEGNLDRFLELFKEAVYTQRPIYKISTKSSLRHLKRKTSPVFVPLVSILRRVLFKPVRRKRKIGWSVLNIPNEVKKGPLKYDFQITLPNGLFVSTLPKNRQVTEVKQGYNFNCYTEKYRIFYSNGVIVIKNCDGSTTILRSNGDIIELTDESECYGGDCARNMAQFYKNQDEETCPYRTTRCSEAPKVKVRSDFVDLYEFGDIPYARKSLLDFNGKKVSVSDGLVTETQLYYVVQEHDYHAEEVFYEREDGMKCVIDKKGKRIFQFPDGTKITSWPEFQNDLIQVSTNPKVEGWVSVVTNYKFEHPDYIAILYDGVQGTTQIFLKDGVLKSSQETLIMTTKKNIALEVCSDCIIFLKTCDTCDGDCISKIHLDQTSKLLEVHDTYDKYLWCDSSGRCETNSNYIKSGVNKKGCDHRWKNENQQLFILNGRGPPGTLLWKDSSIEAKIGESKLIKSRVVNYMNKLTKKQTLEFYTDVHQDFPGRFTMSQMYNHDICLSKFKHSDEKPLFYVTYRVLMEFQNVAEHPEIIAELDEFLERNSRGISIGLFEGITTILNCVVEELKQDKCLYQVSMQEVEMSDQTTSSLSKSLDLDRTTVQDIVAQWKKSCDELKFLIRNRKFPPYFHSDYYRHVLETIKTN
ncbi:uncharacterized protein LOC135265334 [Tribolium castaneum]|uniref:uncharacterized protein LOC135265334 n=1 Tax=Tribolium castaneum TaxID=7070 RepID=UPI0030FF286A